MLQAVNGVGPITSMAFTLTVAGPKRFRRSRDVGSWVGLCPRVRASGDLDPELSISKTGDGYLRRLPKTTPRPPGRSEEATTARSRRLRRALGPSSPRLR
jgi:transposase